MWHCHIARGASQWLTPFLVRWAGCRLVHGGSPACRRLHTGACCFAADSPSTLKDMIVRAGPEKDTSV